MSKFNGRKNWKDRKMSENLTDEEKILQFMTQKALENGYFLTENASKIAKAKMRFFGLEHWKKCPCDPNSDRACISSHCKKDIEQLGICHCSCYGKK